MKFILILLFAVLAVASAQRRLRVLYPRLPLPLYHGGGDDEYAASLGGADVGAYRRSQVTRGGYGRYGGYRDTEVSGLSLGGAKVGLYSRERPDNVPYYYGY